MENSNESGVDQPSWKNISDEEWTKFRELDYKAKLEFWDKNKIFPYSGIFKEPTNEDIEKGLLLTVNADIIPKSREEKLLYFNYLKPLILKSSPLRYDFDSLLEKFDNELSQTPRNLKLEKVKKELEETNSKIEILIKRNKEKFFDLKYYGYCSISEGKEDFYFNKLLEGIFTDNELRPFIEGQVLAQYKNELLNEYQRLDTGKELIEDSTKKMPGSFTHAQKFYLLKKLGIESLSEWKSKGQGSKHKILAKLLGTSEEVAEGVINGKRKLDLKDEKREIVETFFTKLN